MISSALCSLVDLGDQIVLGDIVEEFTLDAEWPAGELDLDLAFFADRVDMFGEHVGDMRGIGGRRDGDNGLGFRHLFSGGEDRCAAEELWPIRIAGAWRISRKWSAAFTEIGDIRRERAIGEIALAWSRGQ